MLWFAEDLEYLPSHTPTPKTKKCSRWRIQSSNVKMNCKDVSDFAAWDLELVSSLVTTFEGLNFLNLADLSAVCPQPHWNTYSTDNNEQTSSSRAPSFMNETINSLHERWFNSSHVVLEIWLSSCHAPQTDKAGDEILTLWPPNESVASLSSQTGEKMVSEGEQWGRAKSLNVTRRKHRQQGVFPLENQARANFWLND